MREYFVDQSVQGGPVFVDQKADEQRVDHDVLRPMRIWAISRSQSESRRCRADSGPEPKRRSLVGSRYVGPFPAAVSKPMSFAGRRRGPREERSPDHLLGRIQRGVVGLLRQSGGLFG